MCQRTLEPFKSKRPQYQGIMLIIQYLKGTDMFQRMMSPPEIVASMGGVS